MDYRYIVPTPVPESEHPYAGLFLGVVPEGRESAVARHIFDELGAVSYTHLTLPTIYSV